MRGYYLLFGLLLVTLREISSDLPPILDFTHDPSAMTTTGTILVVIIIAL